MASSDKFGCTSATEESGSDAAWGFPAGATGTDTSTFSWHYSTVTNPPSKWLICTGFGFALPDTATIDGFLVYQYTRVGGSGGTSYWQAQIVSAGVRVGTAKQCPNLTYSSNMYYQSEGSSSDLWGTSGLTGADANASNFGVAIRLHPSASIAGTKCLASVGVIVYYTAAATGQPTHRRFAWCNHGLYLPTYRPIEIGRQGTLVAHSQHALAC